MNGIKPVLNCGDRKPFALWQWLITGGRICLLLCLLVPGAASSADDEPSADEAATAKNADAGKAGDAKEEAQPVAKSLIKQAYELSRKVTSIEDLEQIVSILDKIDPATVSEKDAKYVRTLQGWALNAKGKRLMEDAVRLRRIGNEKEVEELLQATLEVIGQSIKKDDQRASSYQQRGVILAEQGKWEEALRDFDQAIRLKPDEADSWFNRAEVHYAKQEYELASGDYTHALELNPDDVQSITGRAHCSLQMGNLDEAIADYKQVTEIQQGDKNALTNLADAQQAAGHWEEADKSYRAALKLDTSNARAYQRVAWMYATCPDEKFQKPQIALEAAKTSIQLAGRETSENLETLAAAQAANEQFDLAKRTQQRAIELAGNGDSKLMNERLETFSANKIYRQSEIKRR